MNAAISNQVGRGRPNDWQPCSNRSLERADPLAGTSGFGERWFLIEVDGSWGQHALLQSRLKTELARDLVNRLERAGMRPLAIRRPGRRADQRRAQSAWRWAIVDARPGHEFIRWGQVGRPDQLAEVPLDGSTGAASEAPIICVCTHARHDQCCAVRGRSALARLVAAFPDETWECSHLGGDRFAATMMVFPHAVHFGRVTPDAAVGIVDAYRSGRIDQRFFRGRASLPNVVQAAFGFASAAMHDDRLDAFSLLEYAGVDGAWTVRLSHDSPTRSAVVTVELHESLSVPMLSTCAATVPARVREYTLGAVMVT
ncbi:MAG: sucrase ferredoxin [Microbacteriaceae bacterium]